MYYKLLNAPLTKPRGRFVIYMILGFIIMTGGLQEAIAQKQTSFRTNGKDINIKEFNKEVSKMLVESGIPGLSLAIIDNNEVVFSNGYGRRRLGKAIDADDVDNFYEGYSVKKLKTSKKVDNETVFNGASLSKTLLAFVAFQLADEGKLDLDTPMFKYLENERLQHDERYKLITPRMVLSHSSGLENWAFRNDRNKLEILHNPGEAFVYSGEGYNYLSLIVKEILQKGYVEFIKERVTDPLGMKNTYLKFNDLNGKEWIPLRKSIPSNFAAGHPFGGGQYLLRNTRVNPAYANHFSAEDYAKLITAMFNPAHLSTERRYDMMEAKVEIRDKSANYYGPGFEVIYTKSDTIVSHGGDNPGIKNLMYYSPVNKRGFVIMTNCEWGKSVVAKLNEMTADLELDQYLSPKRGLTFATQYPSPALSLLRTYSQKDSAAMFQEFEALKKDSEIDAFALNGLAFFFIVYGPDGIAHELLKNAKDMYPDSALTHSLLGRYYLGEKEYKLALNHFNKSKALKFSYWDIEEDIEKCKKELSASD